MKMRFRLVSKRWKQMGARLEESDSLAYAQLSQLQLTTNIGRKPRYKKTLTLNLIC